MKTIEELRDYLLENYVDRYGDLDIRRLDFSEFDGNIRMSMMRVKGNLYQSWHDVKGSLFQNEHEVKGDLFQSNHDVKGNYHSTNINVTGTITFEEPKKVLKEITAEELEKMGYKLKENKI